jgi:mRNA interferase RelE/StbE
MKLEIRSSFFKDSGKLPAVLQNKVAELMDRIQNAGSIREIPDCKKMRGYKDAYRIKLGEYRIGFFRLKSSIELVRILPRKDIYRYFP